MRLLVSGSTRTVRGLATRWPGHLGHLLTPANRNGLAAVLATGLPWAVDNGAYSGFDEARFVRRLGGCRAAPRCLFVCCPDVVADARATLALFWRWAPRVRDFALPVALVGQDGLEGLDVPWGWFDAYFVGGSTRWKLSQASEDLCREARRRGKHVHMGRVNSLRRLTRAYDMGCDSADGSSMSRFGDAYVDRFCRFAAGLERQGTLFAGVP